MGQYHSERNKTREPVADSEKRCRDITESKVSVEEKSQIETRLRQAHKIKSKSTGEALEHFPTGTEKILIVDDEIDLGIIATQQLERLGYRPKAMTSSMEALDVFRADPYRYDLVITDMAMPKMTGDKLARELMKIRADIPMILSTGCGQRISREIAEKIGFKASVNKPFSMQKLACTVRSVLDNK